MICAVASPISSPITLPLNLLDRPGLEEFGVTYELQQSIVKQKTEDRQIHDTLIFVEHAPVYTVGRGVEFQSPVICNARSVPWVEINRGGQATYHGPGQLVVYPIFDLEKHGRDVHVFIRKLEAVLIAALREFDVVGVVREGLTGVWVDCGFAGFKKIASIGIGVSRWISYHGLALNVSTDLSYFQAISACGQSGDVVTSLDQICGERHQSVPTMQVVKDAVESAFRFSFGYENRKVATPRIGKPKWLKVQAPGSVQYLETHDIVKQLKLLTVCEEAHCPNRGECWTHHTATFMIMGELCTRRCAFCAVKDGTTANLEMLDSLEPVRVGVAVKQLELKHVVITSVDRDDLPDQGADHYNKTVRAIRMQNPECKIELLIPDMRGDAVLIRKILESGEVAVLNHNVETVPRLYRQVRPGAGFERSLGVLRVARDFSSSIKTKSGIMVGLGETKSEVLEVMDRLREVDCNIITIGQYLQPTHKQLPVQRFVTPEEFEEYRDEGLRRGFSHVESGPLVRSSYHAWKHSVEIPVIQQVEQQ